MTSNTMSTQTEWSQTLNHIHVAIDTHMQAGPVHAAGCGDVMDR